MSSQAIVAYHFHPITTRSATSTIRSFSSLVVLNSNRNDDRNDSNIFPSSFARGGYNNPNNMNYYRRRVTLPILDVSIESNLTVFNYKSSSGGGGKDSSEVVEEEEQEEVVMNPSNTLTPLPSAHLPLDLSSLNMYGVEFKSPSHIRMMREAERNGSYGHVVVRNSEEGDDSGLIGAIGCAVDVMSCSFEYSNEYEEQPQSQPQSQQEADPTATGVTALVRGSFRFIVREVVSTFPYPVLIVDELPDDPYAEDVDTGIDADHEDDDDDYGYGNIPCNELPARCLSAMEAIVKMKLDVPDSTPLEDMILESKGLAAPSQTKSMSEELAAVFDVFRMELVEISDRTLRCFAIGMMAVEIAELEYEQRKDALVAMNGCDRLRTVLQKMESQISMARAKKLAEQLTSTDEDDQVLQVGKPSMPPWLKSIKTGTRLEYFWNEDIGWCTGTVLERLDLGDEILLSIKFDDDGTTHRIPFTAEEKVRWRPL